MYKSNAYGKMSGTSWAETTDLSGEAKFIPSIFSFPCSVLCSIGWFVLVFFCFFFPFFSLLHCLSSSRDKILQTVNHVAKYVAFWFEVDIQIAAAKKRRLMLKILPCNKPATTTVSDLLVIITRSIHLSITKRASF